jgi:hypothetical protein
MSVISVLDLFNWYAKNIPNKLSKKSPYEEIIENDYLNKLDEVVYITNDDDVTVLENLLKIIDDGRLNQTNIDWTMLYPQNLNFGFRGPHLNDKEQKHFSAIEAIFKTQLNDTPQNWPIFKQKKVIGTDSVFGIVLEVGTNQFPSMFVVKSPKNSSKELLHEFLIGQMVCNPLRKIKIPNFPYYFGLIRCSKVEADDKKNIKSWCNETESVPQIIMENIKTTDEKGNQLSAITLKEFILKSDEKSVDSVIMYFMGTMNAILSGWEFVRFSHNDLHTSNVLLRKIVSLTNNSVNKWMIPVAFDNGYLIAKPGDFIPTIIDFGKSSFQNDKITITSPQNMIESEPNSVGKSRPMNDILHLMSFIEKDLKERRMKTSPDFGKRVDLVFEEIYSVFYQLLSTTKRGAGSLFEKVAVIPTLEDFREQTGNRNLFFNLPSTMTFIENDIFIRNFLTEVFKIEMLKPFLQDNYFTQQQFAMVQPIDPSSISKLIEGSLKQSGTKRKSQIL